MQCHVLVEQWIVRIDNADPHKEPDAQERGHLCARHVNGRVGTDDLLPDCTARLRSDFVSWSPSFFWILCARILCAFVFVSFQDVFERRRQPVVSFDIGYYFYFVRKCVKEF